MIGQHIYSRCTEGYFSRSGSKGDSTTVTISRDMFAREDQAKLVARECEAVGTLEDIRPVPSEITGTYRGVLKIKRLNQQLTVVSRAYRLKAEGNMSGERSSGEFRDFTYSSSYILAEEDKGRFLREPEYALNLQNFEPYPSVQARIEESKRNGARGRIEANPEYSLFKNPQKKTEISVFERAGFTQELFIDYISSIVQRVGYMDYRGHENDKVLVVLPDQFRPAWNAAGGNGYAEQIIAATLKVLPDFISQNISAVSCGGANPEASVLKGYQLIFMESGFAKEWVNSEYSIIDLQNKKSYVSGDLDTSYGRFIWDTLQKEEEKAEFNRQYIQFFGQERVYENANTPEMFNLIFGLNDNRKQNFADKRSREQLILGVSYYIAGYWTEYAASIFREMLSCEAQDPGYSDNIKKDLIELVQQNIYPENCQDEIMVCLIQDLASDQTDEVLAQLLRELLESENALAEEKFLDFLKNVREQTEAEWYKKDFLRTFLIEICEDDQISHSSPVKANIFALLKDWYRKCVSTDEWEYTSQLMGALSRPLNYSEITDENMEEIYGNLFFQLFYGNGNLRKQAHGLLSQEEKKLKKTPGQEHRSDVLWNCFKEQCSSKETVLNTEAVWHLIYFATFRDRQFLNVEWRPLFEYIVAELGEKCEAMVFHETGKYLHEWLMHVPAKKAIIQEAIYVSECAKIYNCRKPGGYSDMEEIQQALSDLADCPEPYVSMILYELYAHAEDDRKGLLLEQLTVEQRWAIITEWFIHGGQEMVLSEYVLANLDQTAVFLSGVKENQWLNEQTYSMIVNAYFNMLRHQCQKKQGNNELAAWCEVFQDEVLNYKKIFGENSGIERKLKNKFLSLIAKMNAIQVFGLNAAQVGFLKNMIQECDRRKIFPKDWKRLNVLWCIYYSQDMENLEKMQNIILKSQDISAYLTPVDERLKREERPEYRYFFALLQEQLIMMMEGKKDFNLENVLRKIYGTEYTPVQAVRAALELLLYTERLQLFEADAIRNAAGNGILRLAAREPEAFANNDVAASYQLLKEDTARELNLGRFLNRLDDEWKSIYCKRYGGRVSRREYRESYDRPEQRRPYPGSARTRYELDEDEEMDEEDESSPIILIIAAVVALLVGVAISLVLCLLVPDKITMAISIGLILVGITGDIVIIIHNIIASKRRER